MQEELLKQIERRLETIDEVLKHQISGLCEMTSIVETLSYFLFLATNEKSKVKELKMEQEE